MLKQRLFVLSVCLSFGACFLQGGVFAADQPSHCEVVNVSGDVQLVRKGEPVAALKQGMFVLKGDTLVVGKASSADLAFDEAWQNTARLSENTRVNMTSLEPVRLNMVSGDIYSKLDALVKGTSYEVKTPTAVATVRGTKFRTTHQNGHTSVYNDSETSPVYVYHLDENGNRSGRAIVLHPGESLDVSGEAEAYDSPQDEFDEARDREDQDRLNDDLNRSRSEVPVAQQEQQGNFQNFNN